MLRIPTEASNTKIKGNLCSYFIIKMILKHCWVQGLNCLSLLANPFPGDGVMMRMSCQNLKLQAESISRRANAWLLILEWFCRFSAVASSHHPTAINIATTAGYVPARSQKEFQWMYEQAGTCSCWYGCAYSATPEIQCCWILRSPGANYGNPCACGRSHTSDQGCCLLSKDLLPHAQVPCSIPHLATHPH